MSLHPIAGRALGRVKRILRGAASQRAAVRFAQESAALGRRPGAILLLERLGDIVAASAVVALVRQQHPELRLAWFGRARYRDIARLVPGVDDYVDVDCYGELAAVAAGLADYRVFDLNLNGKSCRCCGGAWRNRSGNTAVDVENYYDHGPLAVAFARVAGLEWQPTAPSLREPEDAAPVAGGRYAVVHSDSEETGRSWHDAGWRELVRFLLEHTDLSIVHVGLRRRTWLPVHDRVHDLGGATSQRELVTLVSRCALFVGIDSGVAQVANAFRRPGLVLFGRYRRFTRYVPYTGSYADGGAFLLRYPSECPFLPAEVAVRALHAVTRRLYAGQPPGLGGPWDVRVQEVDTSAAHRATRQDASRDVAVLLIVDRDEGEWLRRWPGDPHDVVLALPAARFAALVDRLGEVAAVSWLESTGARWVLLDDGTAEVPDAAFASYRYLHHRGAPVVLDGAGRGAPGLLELGDDAAATAAANACCWFRIDLRGRGRDPAAGMGALQRAHRRVLAERVGRPELPAAGAVLVPGGRAPRCGIDTIVRDGPAIRRIDGWAFLESTRSPPAFHCLGEATGDGRVVVRRCAPFARRERTDVAAAFAEPGALFAGMRIDVPPDLRGLGAALRLLVSDRETGEWQLLDLR